MGIIESNKYTRFDVGSIDESAILNFTKEDGSVCHTAYLKACEGKLTFYHCNYQPFDKAFLESGAEMGVIRQISFYELTDFNLGSISAEMERSRLSVVFTPCGLLQR